jgi:hypothetical protein
VAGVTILIVWAAVTTLLRQGSLATVLSAGRAELAAPLLVLLVVATGICERIWPAERRPVLTVWDVLAGLARFPARAGAVGRTGLAGRPVPVEQDGSAGPALVLLAEQLIEPFQAQG